MTFGTTSTDNLGTPLGSDYVPGTANSDLTVIEGYGPINTDSNGQKSAPVSMGMKDGNNATFGAKADTVATSDTGTFNYMQLFKRLLQKFPTIGTNTKANSLSITIATDQGNIATSAADGAVATLGQAADANTVNTVMGRLTRIRDVLLAVLSVQRNAVAVYTLASTTTSGATQNSGDLTVGPYTEISIDINTTAQAGTSPTIQYFYERKGADGIYYILWQSAVLTAAANTISTSIGAGMAYNQSLGATGRLRWVIGGTATPTFTHSLNVQGK